MSVAGDICINPNLASERRMRLERRHRRLWSIAYGSFNPRRRSIRRTDGHHVQFVDWHRPHLLGVALGIILLCSIDAFLTLTLISQGASELNPVMAHLLYRDIAIFAVGKMFMTGVGVLTLVALSRCRVFGKIRVDVGLYLTLAGYIALIAYELSLLYGTF